MESLFAAGALVLIIFLVIIVKNTLTGSAKLRTEIDPLEEAEVYLSYGRTKQAIQLLEHALEKDNSREDIRIKLDALKKQ